MFAHMNATTIIIYICSILLSLTIHEFMHAFVSHKLGDTTAFEGGRVSFNPLRHIDPVMTVALPIVTLALFGAPILAAKPVPVNTSRLKYDEFGMALVAAAGPLTNLALAILASIILHVITAGTLVAEIFDLFMQLNVALFVFNMIPIPPLDGSRVLYSFAPRPLQELMEQIEPYGIFIVFALVLWGGFGGILNNMNQWVLNLLA
jgi:Zn-dependent protease